MRKRGRILQEMSHSPELAREVSGTIFSVKIQVTESLGCAASTAGGVFVVGHPALVHVTFPLTLHP